MKQASPFSAKSKLFVLMSLLLLFVGGYFGAIQTFTKEKSTFGKHQPTCEGGEPQPTELVSKGESSSTEEEDLVVIYTKLYGKYQVKALANSKFSMPSDLEIEWLNLQVTALNQLYTKMTLTERKKVKKVSFPFVKLQVGGKTSYKKLENLTPEERNSLNC